MKLGSMQIADKPVPVFSVGDSWYRIECIWPETKGRDLLSLVSDDILLERLSDTHFLSSVSENSMQTARIPEPIEFCMPYQPRQIICVGRNYAAHAAELGNEVPAKPLLFNKLPSSCIGPNDTIEILEEDGRTDYEGEIGVILGKNAQNIGKDEVFDAVLGYCLVNDVTARDIQQTAKEKGHPWLEAKNRRTFCPFGPYITSRDEFVWPPKFDLELKINGVSRQNGCTDQFIFDIPTLVSHISCNFPLLAGDIIATGTPEGVGALKSGDIIELSAYGLGHLRNPVRLNKK